MSELKPQLEKTARWQKSRRSLTWSEKIRLAEQVRASVAWWRSTAARNALTTHKSGTIPLKP